MEGFRTKTAMYGSKIRIAVVRKNSSTLISSLNDKSHEISTSWSLSSGSRGKRSRGGHSSKSDLCLFFKLRPFRTFRKVDILPNLSSQSSHNLNNFHLFPSELQIYKIGEQQSFKILLRKALTNPIFWWIKESKNHVMDK